MKKILIPIIAVIGFAGYFLSQIFGSHSISISPPDSTSGQPTDSSTGSPHPLVATPQQTKVKSAYKDGSYIGSVADAIYGPVQVEAIIKSGQITDIQILQYPNSRGHSVEVSNYSLPILKSEAIQSQSAQVDVVSGATQTSDAFTQSLSSALVQAKI